MVACARSKVAAGQLQKKAADLGIIQRQSPQTRKLIRIQFVAFELDRRGQFLVRDT